MASAPPIDGRLSGRVPPHDLEAEQSVLGAMLIDVEAVGKVADELRPEDFYRGIHSSIYSAVLSLFEKAEPCDIVTVGAELERDGVLERIGGRAYLAQLEQSVPTAGNILHYASIVKEKALKRALTTVGGELTALGFDESMESGEALNIAQAELFELSKDRYRRDFEQLYPLMRAAMERIETIQASGARIIGLPSGFYDLDSKTNGFKPSELVIVAARPSIGKTSFALNIALNVAVEHKKGVAIFSLEMSRDQIAERLLCQYARIDAHKMHHGQLGNAEFESLAHAMGPLGDAPIWIDDTPALDELSVLTKARRIALRESIGLIIVDYLQLMQSHRKSNDANRVQEVAAISRGMKAMARELEVPVIAVSQLSRGPEQRTDKRPILSDLRDSGALEQDADIVIFLYREDYYSKDGQKTGDAIVDVAKNRTGPTGDLTLRFIASQTRFANKVRNSSPVDE